MLPPNHWFHVKCLLDETFASLEYYDCLNLLQSRESGGKEALQGLKSDNQHGSQGGSWLDLVVAHYDPYYRMVAMTIMMMIMTINDEYPCNVRE